MTTFNEHWTRHSEWQLGTATLSETQQLQDQTDRDEDIKNMGESAKSEDFFDDNATIGRRYTITRIKSRNFLTNIAYVGINKEDY